MYELRSCRNIIRSIQDLTLAAALCATAHHILQAFILTRRYSDGVLSVNKPYLTLFLYTNQRPISREFHGIYSPAILGAILRVSIGCGHSALTGPTELHR